MSSGFSGRRLEVEDTAEIREALADCLMDQGRPDDAEPYLEHIVHQGVPDRVGYLFRLAQTYQIKGEHEKALEVYQQCEEVNPNILQDQTFAKLREESNKRLGTNVAIAPNKIVAKDRAANRRKVLKAVPMVLALAAIAYFGLSFIEGRYQPVFLVNGVDRPYTARINGTSYKLGANSCDQDPIAAGRGSN